MEQRRSPGRVRSVSARVAGYGPRALSALALLLAVSLALGASSISMHHLWLAPWADLDGQTDANAAATPLLDDQDGSGQINPAGSVAPVPAFTVMAAPAPVASGAQLSREQAIALVQGATAHRSSARPGRMTRVGGCSCFG